MTAEAAGEQAPASHGGEAALRTLYLSVVEDAVDVFEPIWTEETGGAPNAGFFDFRRYGNWRDEPYATIIVVPGNGMVVLCYAVLLTQTDRETFGRSRVPRERLLDHAVKSIRWCCLTSAYVDRPYPYLPGTRADFADGKHWSRRLGWRADEIGYLTLGVALLWDRLDAETRTAFRAVAKGAAARERLVRRWAFGQAGNHERVKQDLASTIGAAYLCDDDSDAERFWAAIAGNAIDMVATKHDFARRDILAEGRPISEWAEGWNLYEDYSSDHHGHANIWYGIDMLFEGRAYVEILSRLTGKPLPETFSYKGNGFDGVLEWAKVLCLPNGGLAHPHGAEYDSYYGAGLLAFCYGARFLRDPVAADLEWRAANLLARHSRSVGQYDYHRGSWAKAAMGYLLHRQTPDMPLSASALDAARRALLGTRYYRDQACLIHRSPVKWVSFSWGTQSSHLAERGLCGIVVPHTANELQPDSLVYCHPFSLTGRIEARPVRDAKAKPEWHPPQYRWEGDDTGFSTAGYVDEGPVRRYQAFFSFDEGPCVTFALHRAREACAYEWTGLPVYFYAREGMTVETRCRHADGTALVRQLARTQSPWWCVADDLSAAIVRGPAVIEGDRVAGYNWARQMSYRDPCDVVYAAPGKNERLGAGDVAADAAAVVYPRSAHGHSIDRMTSGAIDLTDRLPRDWRGVVAQANRGWEGERVLALANFGDAATATLQLSFPEGAPILGRETIVEGREATVVPALSSLGSERQTLDLYVETRSGRRLRARRKGCNRFELEPLGDGPVRATVRCSSVVAKEITACRSNGQTVGRWEGSAIDREEGIEVEVSEPLSLALWRGPDDDGVGPTVVIESIETPATGTVVVEVRAADRSGIGNVELECDGRVVGRKVEPPYRWECRPGPGWHTFCATATDNATAPSSRRSFARTVRVGE